MTSPILIAVDLGPDSESVTAAGLLFAEAMAAPAVLVHVNPSQVLYGDRMPELSQHERELVDQRYADDALSRMSELRALCKRPKQIGAPHLLRGDVYGELAAESSRIGAQLVVMGRRHPELRGHAKERRSLRLIREVPNAVLSVSVDQPRRPLSRIFFATDLLEGEWGATRWVARLAGAFGAEVTLMHVRPSEWRPLGPSALTAPLLEPYRQADLQSLADLAGEISALAAQSGEAAVVRHHLVEADSVAETLLARIREERPDLVVVASHGRGPIGKLLLGSVSEELLRRAPCHVLAVPPEELI